MSEIGRFYVCATPIGNLEDVSDRLRRFLREVEVIYAEDTRRTRKLLNHLGLSTPCRSLFSGNERERTRELVDRVAAGGTVALVTDAGMPAISDPGADAIGAVRELGATVTVIPGPSAVTTAIALSGFGGDRFVFEGFLPRRGGQRGVRIEAIADEERPVVIFASPSRVIDDLRDLAAACGAERRVAVTRELTKLHEEVWVGALDEAVAVFGAREPRGEFTLVVDGAEPVPVSIEAAVVLARSLLEGGSSRSVAARAAAAETGVSRRAIYEALIGDQV